jgi:hypothetical protein
VVPTTITPLLATNAVDFISPVLGLYVNFVDATLREILPVFAVDQTGNTTALVVVSLVILILLVLPEFDAKATELNGNPVHAPFAAITSVVPTVKPFLTIKF